MIRNCKLQLITIVIERLVEVENIGPIMDELNIGEQSTLENIMNSMDCFDQIREIKSSIKNDTIEWEGPSNGS